MNKPQTGGFSLRIVGVLGFFVAYPQSFEQQKMQTLSMLAFQHHGVSIKVELAEINK